MEAPPARPRDKAGLLTKLAESRTDLHATIAAIPPGQRATLRDPGGWTVADHLAHVAAWERWKLALLRGTPGHESLGVARETYDSDDTDAINASIQAASADQSLDAAIDAFDRTHAELAALVASLSDDDLGHTLGTHFPDQPGADGDPTLLQLCAYTIDHIAEHRQMLHEMRPA